MTSQQAKIFKVISILLLVFISLVFLYQLITNYYIFKLQNTIEESKILDEKFNKERLNTQVYNNKLDSLYEKKDYKSAIRLCNEYVISNPSRAEFAFNDIAQIYIAKENTDSAIYYFSKAINKSGYYVFALANRGWTYYDIGEYAKAEKDLLKASSYNSNYFYDLGVIQEKLDKEKAVSSYNSYIINNKDTLFCVQRRDSLLKTINH